MSKAIKKTEEPKVCLECGEEKPLEPNGLCKECNAEKAASVTEKEESPAAVGAEMLGIDFASSTDKYFKIGQPTIEEPTLSVTDKVPDIPPPKPSLKCPKCGSTEIASFEGKDTCQKCGFSSSARYHFTN